MHGCNRVAWLCSARVSSHVCSHAVTPTYLVLLRTFQTLLRVTALPPRAPCFKHLPTPLRATQHAFVYLSTPTGPFATQVRNPHPTPAHRGEVLELSGCRGVPGLLLSLGADGCVRLWDVAGSRCLAVVHTGDAVAAVGAGKGGREGRGEPGKGEGGGHRRRGGGS